MHEMCYRGGFITEAYADILPDRQRFPMRNRIIAALSDGLIVVESAEKGGSIITAEYAFSYNKSLMALPGKPNDKASRGCNMMIKKNKAVLVENFNDVLEEMNWDDKTLGHSRSEVPRTVVSRSSSPLRLVNSANFASVSANAVWDSSAFWLDASISACIALAR